MEQTHGLHSLFLSLQIFSGRRFIEKVQIFIDIFILWLVANKWVNFVNENDIF